MNRGEVVRFSELPVLEIPAGGRVSKFQLVHFNESNKVQLCCHLHGTLV